MSLKQAVNEEIRAKEVRLIDGDGNQLGVMATSVALNRAREDGLDLVEISPQAEPPVCRIIDYGKFKFDQAKAEKERQKKARESQIDTKEIQLRPVTDDHDITIKAKKARGFLDDGDRVKVVVRFRGRELAHKEMGRAIVDAFITALGDHKVERPLQMSERHMFMIVAPTAKRQAS